MGEGEVGIGESSQKQAEKQKMFVAKSLFNRNK